MIKIELKDKEESLYCGFIGSMENAIIDEMTVIRSIAECFLAMALVIEREATVDI